MPLNRALAAGVTATLAIGASSLSPAIAAPHVSHRLKISEVQNIATVGTTGTAGTPSLRLISAGAFVGKIGSHGIEGALRAAGQVTTPSTSIVRGTEFDLGGSRSFVLHIRFVIANGTVTDHGSGKWTGGTFTYAHARGSFTIAGSRPVNGASSIRLTGMITY